MTSNSIKRVKYIGIKLKEDYRSIYTMSFIKESTLLLVSGDGLILFNYESETILGFYDKE